MNLPMILMTAAQETQKTGLWASFVNFLSSILEALNKVTGLIPEPFGGYGLAIILFTVIMRLALLPLDLKSRKANQKMQEVQPLLNEVNKKYKNDPDKLNKKTMEIYKEYQVNPLGGCLPMLLQMPLFFALFAALNSISAREIANESINSFLWIRNIWQPDSPLKSFTNGTSISLFAEGFNGLFILPLLAGVTSFYQMKLTQPKGGNPQMKGFSTIMPLMSVWFCINYTASFAIYWVTANLFQIAQSLLLKNTFSTQGQEVEERKGDQK